jgi:hypothetical protein
MGDIIELCDYQTMTSIDPATIGSAAAFDAQHFIEEEKERLDAIRRRIQSDHRINGRTCEILAKNLGEILARDKRNPNRNKLAAKALRTTMMNPSQRLSRFQILPGKEPSKSSLGRLSKDARQYENIVVAAAEMRGESAERYLLQLVAGTKFDSANTPEDLDLEPAQQIAKMITKRCDLIVKEFDIAGHIQKRRLYYAQPKKVSRRDGRFEYTFEVEHDGPYWSRSNEQISTISSVGLFSIVRQLGTCEYRGLDGAWMQRPIMFAEHISLALIFDPNHGHFSRLRIRPTFILPKIVGQRGTKHIAGHNWREAAIPADFQKPWIIDVKSLANLSALREYQLDQSGEILVSETSAAPHTQTENLEYEAVRLGSNHGLDLQKIVLACENNRASLKMFSRANIAGFYGRYEPIDMGSVSRWFDVPISNVVRAPDDAFFGVDVRAGHRSPTFDTSRSLSPPDSMLAEIECSLYWDGFQGTFDASEINDYLDRVPGIHHYVDENGNEQFDEDTGNYRYIRTFLDLIEEDVAALSNGFSKWLIENQSEARSRAKKIVDDLDRKLADLKASRD